MIQFLTSQAFLRKDFNYPVAFSYKLYEKKVFLDHDTYNHEIAQT